MKSANHARDLNSQLLGLIPRVVIWFCIALILFLMPIYIDLSIKHVFNAAKELLFGQIMCVALAAWGVDLFFRRRLLVPCSRSMYFYTAFIGWMALSLGWSTSFSLSIREFGTQFGCFVLCMMILANARIEEDHPIRTIFGIDTHRLIQALVTCAILGGVIANIYGMFQYYDLDDHYFQMRGQTEQVETFLGKIEVPAGRSPMGQLCSYLPFLDAQKSSMFFQSLLLPQKPDETWKDYSFMGHRNYYSGYLVLLIPLVLVRLIRKLQILLPFEAREGLNVKGVHPVWDFFSALFYGTFLISFINAVILTQTRGAILGMTVSSCFILLSSLLLANRETWAQKQKVLIAVFGSLGTVFGLIVLLFVTKNQTLFWVLVGAAGILFLGLLFYFRHIVSRPILIAVFLTIVAGSYKVLTAPKYSETVRGHLSTADRIAGTTQWDGSAHQRTLIYSTTLRMITDSVPALLFGHGHGTFGIHYMHYQVQLFLDTETAGRFLWDTNKSIYAHNEYIHFWSEIGFVGLILMLLFWGTYVHRGLAGVGRLYRREYQENPLKVLTVLALVAGNIGTLTHNVFAFDLHLMYSMVTFYAWIGFALLLSDVKLREVNLETCPIVRYALIAGYAVLAGWLSFGFSNYHMDVGWKHITLMIGAGLCLGVIALVAMQIQTRNSDGEEKGLFSTLCLILCLGFSSVLAVRMSDLYSTNRYWREAFARFSNKQWSEAFDLYQMALQRDSSLGELLFDFGRAMMDSNNNPRVPKADIDKFNIATIRRNLNYKTMYMTDSMPNAQVNGNPDEELKDEDLSNNFIAISAFLEATHNFTDPANFHNIALCFYKEGQQQSSQVLLKKSEEYYQKAIDLNPIYAQSLSNLGYIKALRGENDEALSMLERAARLPDGQTATTYVGLAMIYMNQGNYEKALEMYLKLEEISPGSDTSVKIGTLYSQLKDRAIQESQSQTGVQNWPVKAYEYAQKAEEYFTRAAQALPGSSQERARVVFEGLRQRWTALQQKVRSNPEDGAAILKLALTHVEMATSGVAFPEREQFLQSGIGTLAGLRNQMPTNVEVNLALARAYEISGDLVKLREIYSNLLRLLSPTHPEYPSIRRKLDLLR